MGAENNTGFFTRVWNYADDVRVGFNAIKEIVTSGRINNNPNTGTWLWQGAKQGASNLFLGAIDLSSKLQGGGYRPSWMPSASEMFRSDVKSWGGPDLRNLYPATSKDQLVTQTVGTFGFDAGTVVLPGAAAKFLRGGAPAPNIVYRAITDADETTVPSKLAQGLQFEANGVSRASTEAFLPGQSTQRLSVRAFNADGTLAEGRTVLDMAGYRLDNGELGALEFKLSPDAPYTARQELHFPLLEQNGGVIVGAKGEAIGLPAGTRIAPTAPVRVNGPTLPKPGEWWKF